MLFLDYLTQGFMVLGLVGTFFGAYIYMKQKDRWALAAAVSCALGFGLPFYGYTIPGVLANVLVPYTIWGAIVSFLLNVVPWFYLLPFLTPAALERRKGSKGQPRRSGGRR